MRAVRYHETGGPDVLDVEEIDRPKPGEDEVLVEVAAASVNHLDLLFRRGVDMFVPRSFPVIPGSDFAGTVAAVGANVTTFEAGDRVLGAGLAGSPMGGYAEFTVAPTSIVGHLPSGVDFDAAAGVGHAGVTTWRALVDHAGVEPGDTCLVHGGSGGVGHLAVQLATVQGGHVITSSSSESRRARLETLGAAIVLDYTDGGYRDALADSAPDGVDVILDGHLDEYFELDIEVLANGGRIVCIEFTGEEGGRAGFSQFHTRLANWKEASMYWVGMPNAPDIPFILERYAQLIAADRLVVETARTFGLEDAAAAHRTMAEENFLGNLIIRP